LKLFSRLIELQSLYNQSQDRNCCWHHSHRCCFCCCCYSCDKFGCWLSFINIRHYYYCLLLFIIINIYLFIYCCYY
jgi:hypothetical protein